MKTIAGMFDSMADAHRAVTDLEQLGVPRSDISVVSPKGTTTTSTTGTTTHETKAAEGAGIGATTGALAGGTAGLLASLGLLAIPGIGPLLAAGAIVATLTGAGIGAAAGGLIGGLIGMGIPEEDAELYEEGIRRGGSLVTAHVDDAQADQAAAILNRHKAVDMTTRTAQWRSAGWTPKSAATSTTSTTSTGDASSRPAATPRRGDDTTRVPVVEEQLQVGKRQVEQGGVRVYTRATEKPVTEQVSLRKETVHVERNPADRPATEADMKAFRDASIEVRERSEEAVVNKQARVTGEVSVRKDVEDRTETVRDTVRKTDVQVEKLNSPNSGENK